MEFRIHIGKHERGLRFRRNDFAGLLGPGSWIVPGRFVGRDHVEVVSLLATQLRHRKLELLVRDEALRNELHVLEVADEERVFVWRSKRLAWILGPGLHAFWKQPIELEFERFSTRKPRLVHDRLQAILGHEEAEQHLMGLRVESTQKALVLVDGEVVDEFGAGSYAFWKTGAVSWRVFDLREQIIDIAGQEIMTADKLSLRVNMIVGYRVVDARKALGVVEAPEQSIYRRAQLALRAIVGTRELDALLGDKESVARELGDAVRDDFAAFGVELVSVGLRDVILPGDMKTILNQVLEAQKRAEANLIQRREETAAARSQANTARLLKDNPALARMRELEALQGILAGAKVSFVLGQGDLGEQVRSVLSPNGED